MRILCLHGQGASSTIFETQLSRLVSTLPPHWALDFVDAPIECGPGLNISGIYPAPYYCFFESYTPERMSDAVSFVREIVEEDGPYDAIFGFSQGASVAAAYLSTYSSKGQDVSPIAFATFFCTALIPPSIAAKTDRLEETVGSLVGPSGLPIPTVHVLGTKDLCFGQSAKLLESCEGKYSSDSGSEPSSTESTPSASSNNLTSYFSPGLAQPIYFQGGHDVPKDATTVARMRNAVEHAARIAYLG